MPKCCIHAPAAVHNDSLKIDAQAFSAWVGGMWPLTRPPLSPPLPGLTSALHVDLKLWTPRKAIRRHMINRALDNAVSEARARHPNAPGTDSIVYRTYINNNLNLPSAGQFCSIFQYDLWLLSFIRNTCAHFATPGTFLSTIGMAQKVVNLYNKYMACWAYAGQYNLLGFAAPADPTGVKNFVCALHCPLDNILLLQLARTDIGYYLQDHGLLQVNGNSVLIQQDDGINKTWSNLDCPTAYYALQWFIRRIAMATWPSGCSVECIHPSDGIDPKGILKRIFPDGPTGISNWWEKLNACPDEKFQNSAIQTIQQQITSASTIATPKPQSHPEPNVLRDTPRSPMPNAPDGDRPCIKIKGNAQQFCGLRLECDSNRNYWGCVYQNGTLAITTPTRDVLHLAAINTVAHPWEPTPLRAYVAQRRFPTPDDAFRFLATYFNLCACDQEAINKLNGLGVNWIPLCNPN